FFIGIESSSATRNFVWKMRPNNREQAAAYCPGERQFAISGSRTANFRRGFSLSPGRRKTRFRTSTDIWPPQLCGRANSISTSRATNSAGNNYSRGRDFSPLPAHAKLNPLSRLSEELISLVH